LSRGALQGFASITALMHTFMTRDEHDAVDAHDENDENDEQHDNEDVNSSAVLNIRQRLAQYALSSPVKRSTASTSSHPTSSPRKRTRSQFTSPRKRSTKAKDSLDTDLTAGVDGNFDEASPRKKAKQAKRGYAAPEKYEHLSSIPDYLREGLDGVSCLVFTSRAIITSSSVQWCYVE
jgi:hypothetical protein